MGEVELEGIVASEAIATAVAEDNVEDTEFLGDDGCPTKEDVKDDEKFMFMVLDEGFEGWLEGGAGLDKANDEVVGDGVMSIYMQFSNGVEETFLRALKLLLVSNISIMCTNIPFAPPQ